MSITNTTILLKFPAGLAKALISRRDLVTKYQTNQVIKAVGLYSILKTTNVCGTIRNYRQQFATLLPLCKCSYATFYTRLEACQKLGLLKVTGSDITLTGWEKACSLFEHEHTIYQHIYYKTNDLQTPEHLINALALHEKKGEINVAIQKKFTQNPSLAEAYELYYDNFSNDPAPAYSSQALLNLQYKTFAEGAPRTLYDLLHKFNPDNNITVHSIKRLFNFKSHRSATYLKRSLAKRGLIQVQKRVPVTHCYINKVAPIHDFDSKARKEKCYHTWYTPDGKKRTWYLTDQINISPTIFTKP